MNDTLDLGNLMVHLTAEDTLFDKVLNKSEKKMLSMAKNLESIGRKMTLKVTTPIVAGLGFGIKAFADFDAAMTKSLAIMGDVPAALRGQMEAEAVRISNQSVKTSTELAESYYFLAAAGLSAEQSLASLSTVESFAVAGMFDMAKATDLLTDAQSALGLTVKDTHQNMVNMTHVSDVLVGANTLANASVEQFSAALTSEAGAAIKSFNLDLEEGVAVLAAYADQGIKAEHAGTTFSRMIRLMTKGFMDNQSAWRQFNMDIYDAQGELKPLWEIIGMLTDSLGKLSTEQKVASLEMLGFQARSQQAILPLLGLGDRIKEYNDRLVEMSGITQEIRSKQMQSFSAQVKELWNQIKNAAKAIGKDLVPHIKSLMRFVESGVKWWNGLSDATKRFLINSALIVAAVGPMLVILGSLVKTLVLLKVAAIAGATSVGILSGALGAVLVAVAAWNLGTYFYNEFQIVQEVAANVATMLLNTWDRIAFGFKVMGATIKMIWKMVVVSIKVLIGTLIGDLARAVKLIENLSEKIPGVEKLDLGGVFLESFATKLKAEDAETVLTEYFGSIKKYNDELTSNIAANEQAYVERMTEITRDFQKKNEVAPTEDVDKSIEVLEAILKDLQTGFEDVIIPLNETEQKVKDMLVYLQEEIDMVGMSNKEREKAVALLEFQKAAAEAYGKETEEYLNKVKEFNQLWDVMQEKQQQMAPLTAVKQWAEDAKNIMEGVGEAMTSALDQTADAITDVFMGVKTDFDEIAQSLLQDITNIIVKAMMAKAITSTLGAFGVPVFHGGGDVGGAAPKRMASPLSFANAPRYHNGANEVPAILQRGERVLTEEEAESMDRGMMGQNVSVNFNVSAIDAQGTAQFFKNNKRILASQIQNAVNSGHPLRKMMNR
jgi:TP901 family phage tail tape measure protein/lambda family phage tail tape measure protein